MNENPYVYIFTRMDLSKPQQAVQSAHAALEAGFYFNKPEQTCFIILFGVKDQKELLEAAVFLERRNIKFKMFFEPDYDTGYTSIATEPLYGKQRNALKRFKLLT